MVRKYAPRIAFAHIRNVKHFANGNFSGKVVAITGVVLPIDGGFAAYCRV